MSKLDIKKINVNYVFSYFYWLTDWTREIFNEEDREFDEDYEYNEELEFDNNLKPDSWLSEKYHWTDDNWNYYNYIDGDQISEFVDSLEKWIELEFIDYYYFFLIKFLLYFFLIILFFLLILFFVLLLILLFHNLHMNYW